jgi:hypothetical protein
MLSLESRFISQISIAIAALLIVSAASFAQGVKPESLLQYSSGSGAFRGSEQAF